MIALYIRVSSIGQRDNYSVDTQRERGKAFALHHSEEYTLYDETKSGKDLERPEFIRLMRDVETGRISKVWVIEASRLTRDVEDAQVIKRLFKKHKVELYVNDQHIDLLTSESIFTYNITSAVSEYERAKIIDRVIRSRHKQIDNGEQSFCSLFGYDFVFSPDGKKVWQINEKEAAVIRAAFRWYSEGASYLSIANRLNDSGYVSKRGKGFAASKVRKMLERPEYFGMTRDTKKNLVPSKIYAPIIDSSLRPLLDKQKEKGKRIASRFREGKSLLGGMLKCSVCGTPYYLNNNFAISKKTGERLTYVRYLHLSDTTPHRNCSNYPKLVNTEQLETFVDFCYRVLLRNTFEIKSLIEMKEKEVYLAERDLVSQIESTKTRLDEIEGNRKKLIAGIGLGLYTLEDIQDPLKALNAKKAEIESTHNDLKTQLELKREDIDLIMRTFADKSIESYENATVAERRDIYSSAIRSFVVDSGWIRLTFITDREFNCPVKKLHIYIKAIKELGTREPFTNNRYRWEEILKDSSK